MTRIGRGWLSAAPGGSDARKISSRTARGGVTAPCPAGATDLRVHLAVHGSLPNRQARLWRPDRPVLAGWMRKPARRRPYAPASACGPVAPIITRFRNKCRQSAGEPAVRGGSHRSWWPPPSWRPRSGPSARWPRRHRARRAHRRERGRRQRLRHRVVDAAGLRRRGRDHRLRRHPGRRLQADADAASSRPPPPRRSSRASPTAGRTGSGSRPSTRPAPGPRRSCRTPSIPGARRRRRRRPPSCTRACSLDKADLDFVKHKLAAGPQAVEHRATRTPSTPTARSPPRCARRATASRRWPTSRYPVAAIQAGASESLPRRPPRGRARTSAARSTSTTPRPPTPTRCSGTTRATRRTRPRRSRS